MQIIKEEKLHLVYTVADSWQEKAKTKLHMLSKGYKVHNEYMENINGLVRVVTVFSKQIEDE
jgi:hypothetical protein